MKILILSICTIACLYYPVIAIDAEYEEYVEYEEYEGYETADDLDEIEHVEPEYLEMLFSTGQYEEFARLLGIPDVNLVRPREGPADNDTNFQEGLEDGDILYNTKQKEQYRQGIVWPSQIGGKWETNIVPYVINKEGYSLLHILTIKKAINQWNLEVKRPIYRPRRSEEDYVMFFNGTDCYSNMGRQGGQQPLSLGAKCLRLMGTILHEMEHTVGIMHEHQRPDRDQYVKILYENIPEKWHRMYEKESFDDYKILGDYDYYSVMHYPLPAPETLKDSFAILKDGVERNYVGQRVDMTELDRAKIRKLYP